jgi:transcriptional regulator with XRE-family HTH domain
MDLTATMKVEREVKRMDNLKVGQYIKERIKEKGITQDQLAEMMNVTSSAVSQVLSGKNMFDVANLQVLSRILDEPIDKILNAGEDPATYLEILAMKSAADYKKEDPNLGKIKDKDHKGQNLFEYILRHKNVELIRLFNDKIVSEMSNDIRLETILIQNEEIKMLEQLYHNYRFRRKFVFTQEITDFPSSINNKSQKELSNEEIEYLQALTSSTNEKIFEITDAFKISQNNIHHFSKIVEFAIMFDKEHILKYDFEQRLKKFNEQNTLRANIEQISDAKFSKLLKKSIEYKSVRCIDYCYNALKSFNLQNYFSNLINTKDKSFIKDFISKYKNKSVDSFFRSNIDNGKFNNLESLKQLIETNNYEILEYSIEFSTQEALDEALFITKGNQIEIIKLLVKKGARFMVQDTYSSNNRILLEPLSTMVKYLFDELENKTRK